mmetsp:Transcript_17607/g.43020  ORF Transcript_17607/g.43020 Transcript_17607/m.43020 type:complete len:405 (-) Transcript_17607:268-1482(-)
MTSLCESQAFLDQFDKVLPLCEKGDAVTVINALHVLNSITQASIAQAHELGRDRDFVCSFLLELELALELYISPSRKLGTQDGGLPALYSFGEDEVAQLAAAPSRATKAKVLKFLDALGVAPSPEFAERTVAETVSQFLGFQVKPTHPKKERAKRGNISWADQCSSGSDSDSDCSSLPSLEEDDEDVCTPSPSSSKQRSPRSSVASVEEYEVEEYEEEEEEEEVLGLSAFLASFLEMHLNASHSESGQHGSHPAKGSGHTHPNSGHSVGQNGQAGHGAVRTRHWFFLQSSSVVGGRHDGTAHGWLGSQQSPKGQSGWSTHTSHGSTHSSHGGHCTGGHPRAPLPSACASSKRSWAAVAAGRGWAAVEEATRRARRARTGPSGPTRARRRSARGSSSARPSSPRA